MRTKMVLWLIRLRTVLIYLWAILLPFLALVSFVAFTVVPEWAIETLPIREMTTEELLRILP